jgi:hypothetical protein
MLHLRIRHIAPIAALVVLACAPVAGARSSHPYKSHITSAPVSTAGGYPQTGGSTVLAGSLTTDTEGPGALVDRLTITGQPQPNVFTFKGTEVAYFAGGSIRDAFTGYSMIMEDGSQSVVANGTITGGTGRYRGATGRYSFGGTTAPGSTLLVGGSTGVVAF